PLTGHANISSARACVRMASVTRLVLRVVVFFLFRFTIGSNTTTSQFLALPAVCRHVVAVAARYSALVNRPMTSALEGIVFGLIGMVAMTLLPASICGCVELVAGTKDQVARSSVLPTFVLIVGQPASTIAS